MEKTLKKFSKLIFICLTILGFIFLFFDFAGFINESTSEISYPSSGYELIFGRIDNGYVLFYFNIFGFVMLLLMLTSIILLFIIKDERKMYHTNAVLFLYIAIIYTFLPLSVNHAASGVSNYFIGLPMLYVGSFFMIFLFVSYLSHYIRYKKNKEKENKETKDIELKDEK